MNVLVIGTDPPCIRCHTTFKRAKEVAGQFPGIEVRKIVIHSEEAEKYGKVESGRTLSNHESCYGISATDLGGII